MFLGEVAIVSLVVLLLLVQVGTLVHVWTTRAANRLTWTVSLLGLSFVAALVYALTARKWPRDAETETELTEVGRPSRRWLWGSLAVCGAVHAAAMVELSHTVQRLAERAKSGVLTSHDDAAFTLLGDPYTRLTVLEAVAAFAWLVFAASFAWWIRAQGGVLARRQRAALERA